MFFFRVSVISVIVMSIRHSGLFAYMSAGSGRVQGYTHGSPAV